MRNSTLTTHHCQKAKAGKCLPSFYTMKSSFAAVFCSQPNLSRVYHERVKHMTNKKTFYVCMLTLVTALLVLSGCASSSSNGNSSGINGYKVKFIEKDSQYNPQVQVTQYSQIRNQVLMIADSLGTPTTFAIKDQAAADHMLISAATLSSALAREKYLILVGTPYRL